MPEKNKNFMIAKQTKIAFLGFILLFVALILSIIQTPDRANFIPAILIFIVSASVALYNLNCTIVGDCNVYAWIMSSIITIMGSGLILFLIYNFFRR